MVNAIEILKVVIAGLFCGGVFAIFHLPIPAPSTFTAILGIASILVGYLLVGLWR